MRDSDPSTNLESLKVSLKLFGLGVLETLQGSSWRDSSVNSDFPRTNLKLLCLDAVETLLGK